MNKSWIRRSLATAATLFVVLLSGCTVPRGPVKSAPPPSVLPVLTVDYVLGPPRGDADTELAELSRCTEQAASLRRAWILLQNKQPQSAVDVCAEVLFGREQPSPSAEAFARYLRALAFERMGMSERGNYDRARARELALDSRLRARIEADLPAATPRSINIDSQKQAAHPIATAQKRTSWNPATPIASKLDPMEKIYRLTVHHSAIYLRDTSLTTCAAQIKHIQRDHMNPDRGYADIGYHFLIDPAGRIWEGRDLRWQGAHARGENNRGNIGICLLGNFMRGREGQRPTTAQLASLRQLIGDLSGHYSIANDQIHCHKDFVKTDCPGPLLASQVQDIAQSLRNQPTAARRSGVASLPE